MAGLAEPQILKKARAGSSEGEGEVSATVASPST
jgi:hypothetical protein